MIWTLRKAAVLAFLLASACADPSSETRDAQAKADADAVASDAAAMLVTYQRDIRPLIERHCLPCHAEGGGAPFPLDSWEGVRAVAPVAAAAVAARRMPPFPADQSCRELTAARTLTEAERSLFAAFRAHGFQEGSEADYVPPQFTSARLGPPDIQMRPERAYRPKPDADEYVCFVLEQLPTDTYLRGLQIVPLQPQEVHHAQLHVLTPLQRENALQAALQEDDLGYECAFGTRVGSQLLYSYRPGSEATVFAPGDAAFVEAGSSLLLQVHYHNVSSAGSAAPAPDQTEVRLWTSLEGELPQRIMVRTGVTATVSIPAGAPHAVSRTDSPMRMLSSFGSLVGFGGTFLSGEIMGIAPHAHQLATRLGATVTSAQGAATCLVDVPRWDFHFQLDYLYSRGVPYEAEDRLVVSCEYDNSPEHQPAIDGVVQPARDVTWGERTSDEMCLFYLWLRFEREAYMAARKSGPLP